jgi:type 1 glutamine amidotransferase
MQELLRPWLDGSYEKAEGTDSNVREFVAQTLPEIQAAVPRRLSATVMTKRRILVLTTGTLGPLHAPGAAGLLALLREAGKRYDALEFTEVFSDRAIDPATLGRFDAVVLNNVGQTANPDFYNQALPQYVQGGGGLLAVHGTALLFRRQPEAQFNTLLGGFTTENPVHPGKHCAVFPVKLIEPDHPLVAAFRGTKHAYATKGQWLDGQKRRLVDVRFEAPDMLTDELYTFHPQRRKSSRPSCLRMRGPWRRANPSAWARGRCGLAATTAI